MIFNIALRLKIKGPKDFGILNSENRFSENETLDAVSGFENSFS